jgi:hypothetical protein
LKACAFGIAKELKAINWKEVDDISFVDCDNLDNNNVVFF